MNDTLVIFSSQPAFLRAVNALERRKPGSFEAFVSHNLPEAAEFAKKNSALNPVYFCCLLGGITGLVLAAAGQWYANVLSAPLDVGGRPLNSWPAFVPVCFVLTVLFAGLFAFAAFMFRLRLPEPHHPIFDLTSFDLSRDRSYLWIAREDLALLRDFDSYEVRSP